MFTITTSLALVIKLLFTVNPVLFALLRLWLCVVICPVRPLAVTAVALLTNCVTVALLPVNATEPVELAEPVKLPTNPTALTRPPDVNSATVITLPKAVVPLAVTSTVILPPWLFGP